ncbi:MULTISPECIES: MFS transporter [unclassified Mesorhizobium]|uniref:MFS transporter n=1 Tax=unclassified Mesorhizobium TaxID=325217 RepID=UPI000BAE9AFD|nr:MULTISPECIES: MFS transporter [unclassified Mesorhizobium]TGT56922.1 MFS transporter [Mesorhizobium sp. M00.F.Ca.ET.170.01.1.1]PBB85571.1 MFS transporter [Mesorhizobium sp. WSM3876]RWB71807.1 MAG: MFS transporter [Mesorhizobium sp.]RWB84940.1 MAG: MFS transporter [Mesorhizobium sp.]RWE25836.1 MAG: MFS transporter [Mesorhizobium sp.]
MALQNGGALLAEDANRWSMLGVLCLAVVLSLTTWFSATAIVPELRAAWQLSGAVDVWLTNGVQIGFVAGALAASLVNLPDIVRLNRLMAISALVAAAANASLLLQPGPAGLIAARILTGVALAGVYPPALKLVSTWFVRGRGLALGALIGALTLGSSLPHLFRALAGSLDWQLVVMAATAAALAGSMLFWFFAREGPYAFGKAVFQPRQIGAVFRIRPLMLVNIGYLGHMWELYAMWAWLLAYTRAALEAQQQSSPQLASVLTFLAIAVGAGGCLIGGVLSDRFGRSLTTAGMMMVSGSCAIVIGFAFDGPLWLFGLVILVWGVSVVGDSAQFSAAATELADQRFVGTALSVQLGLGFGLTVLTIWLLPHAAALLGWRWAFLVLAPGPLVGTLAMLSLRRLPAAASMAHGKR